MAYMPHPDGKLICDKCRWEARQAEREGKEAEPKRFQSKEGLEADKES
jgi:hypothetical protein